MRSRLDLPSFTEMQVKLKLPDKRIEYASETYLKETGTKFTFQICLNYNDAMLIWLLNEASSHMTFLKRL